MDFRKIVSTARLDYIIVVGLFAVSRILYALLGVQFDSTTLPGYMQFIDQQLLRERLLESLWYFHAHPPLLNLFTGVGLKLFGDHADVYFSLSFHALGLAMALAVYLLTLRLTAARPAAVVATALLVFSPAFVLYENWLMYTFPSAALLTISALLLHQYLATRDTRWAAAFFTVLAILLLTRSIFHLAWMVLVTVLLAVILRRWWRQVSVRGCRAAPHRRAVVRQELLLLRHVRREHYGGPGARQHHDPDGGARAAVPAVSGGPHLALRIGLALRAPRLAVRAGGPHTPAYRSSTR